jgi:anion-transporting  ArsA/GET3 family ATPase
MTAGAAVSGDNLRSLVERATTIVCCGPGGVGKTTAAASIGVEAARLGRKACVVTIDPARRLADALGVEELANTAKQVPGDWPGELWALMLDTKSTFDELVRANAASPEQAESILENRLYRNLSQALSGTQEYMATEKLYELHESGAYDVVVVDTPPTRNALDFIEAPRRLVRFLDNRIFRLLMMPTRAYLRAVSVATQAFLRTVSRVVGSEVVDDAVAFFQAFEGMEQGFRDRAARVEQLLAESGTCFVVVTSPRRDAVEEARFFVDKLGETGLDVAGLVVNRVHPRFENGPQADGVPEAVRENLRQLQAVAEREEVHFADLARRVEPAPVVRIPFLPADVHDIEGLRLVGDYLI